MSCERWVQKEILLQPRTRGIHIVTDEIIAQIPELASFSMGLAHLSLLHTSAGLALNERIEPEVRSDLSRYMDGMVPEGDGLYLHSYEGYDDMPAHIKCVLTGTSLSVPISHGAFRLGTWQGLFLCEFRNRGGVRRIHATLHGVEHS